MAEAAHRRPHAREPRAHRRRLRELLTTQPLANVLEVVIAVGGAAFGRRLRLAGGGVLICE